MSEDRNPRQSMSVKFPAALALTVGDKQVEWGGIELCGYLMDTQPQFNMDAAGLRAGARIEIALTGKTNTDPLTIEWRDLELLQKAADKPRNGYPVQPARRALPYVDALNDATESGPAA